MGWGGVQMSLAYLCCVRTVSVCECEPPAPPAQFLICVSASESEKMRGARAEGGGNVRSQVASAVIMRYEGKS